MGNFPLCLSCLRPSAVSLLHRLIQQLVPCTHLVPLARHYLEQQRLVPQTDVTLGVLRAGELQLAPGSVLVLDETQLEGGQFVENGACNLQALESLVANQELHYQVPFGSSTFQTDIPTLVLSSGCKSVLSVGGSFWCCFCFCPFVAVLLSLLFFLCLFSCACHMG